MYFYGHADEFGNTSSLSVSNSVRIGAKDETRITDLPSYASRSSFFTANLCYKSDIRMVVCRSKMTYGMYKKNFDLHNRGVYCNNNSADPLLEF